MNVMLKLDPNDYPDFSCTYTASVKVGKTTVDMDFQSISLKQTSSQIEGYLQRGIQNFEILVDYAKKGKQKLDKYINILLTRKEEK